MTDQVRRYGAILADPPWHFRNEKTGGNHTSGASQKYSTMPTRDLAARDAIAFVWGTAAMDPDAREDLKPRLEMFARGLPRPGWHGWGNQCEGGIALPDLEGVRA